MKKFNLCIILLMVCNITFATENKNNQELNVINNYKNKILITLQDIVFPDRRSHEIEVPASFGYSGKWYWGVNLRLIKGKMIDPMYAKNRKTKATKCTLSFDRSQNPKYPKLYIIPEGTEISVKEVKKGQNKVNTIYYIKLLSNDNRNHEVSFWCTVKKNKVFTLNDFLKTIDGIFDFEMENASFY